MVRGYLDRKGNKGRRFTKTKLNRPIVKYLLLHISPVIPIAGPVPATQRSYRSFGTAQAAPDDDAYVPRTVGIGLIGFVQLRLKNLRVFVEPSRMVGFADHGQPDHGEQMPVSRRERGYQRFLVEYAKQQLKAEQR